MQIKAAPLVDPINPTTANHEEDRAPDRGPDSGNAPTPPVSGLEERLSHAASATNSNSHHTLDMATTYYQYIEEKSATPSFDRVAKISKNLVQRVPGRGDKPTWTMRLILWLEDQKERAAEGARSDGGEAHENPWKPCQPSEDAEEWNGGEGLDGAPPGADIDPPATPPVTEGPTVSDEEYTA
jgi:hypothetical protein